MIELSTCEEVAPKGARGVFVGLAVFVGGTSEKGVFVKKGVNVGRGVLLGVNSSVGLGVHVAANPSGVTVAVGIWEPRPPGGKILKLEPGLRKTNTKYAPTQAVAINTSIESISHVCMGAPCGLDGFPSKLKSSFIYVAPL